MNKLSKKISALAIGFLLIIAILFFLILPAISDIKTISADVADKKSILEKKSFANQDIKEKLEKINKIKKSPEFYSSFINQGQELDFIETIEKIADRYSIKQNLKITNQADIKREDLSLSINLKGNYISLMQYLTSLEKEKYYINIESLTLSSDKKTETVNKTYIDDSQKKDEQLKLIIKAKVYFK